MIVKAAGLALLGVGLTLATLGQPVSECEKALLRESGYTALYHARRLTPDSRQSARAFLLHKNNRLLEAHLLSRSPDDTITFYLARSSQLAKQSNNREEDDYLEYLRWYGRKDKSAGEAERLWERNWLNQQARACAFLRVAEWLQAQRKYEFAREVAHVALNYFRTDSVRYYWKLYVGKISTSISNRNLGRLLEAELGYQQALRILESIPEPLELEHARVWGNLGNVYQDLGRYREAKHAYEKSIALRVAGRADSTSLVTAYNNKGTFLIRYGHFSEARHLLESAFRLARPASEREQVVYNTLVSNLCFILREEDELQRAMVMTERALTASARWLSSNHPSVVRLQLRRMEDAIALKDLSRARKAAEEVNRQLSFYPLDDPLRRECSLPLISFLVATQQWDSCRQAARAFIESTKKKPGNGDGLAFAYNKLGNVEESQQAMTVALRHYDSSYYFARKSGDIRDLLVYGSILAEARYRAGLKDSAERCALGVLLLNQAPNDSGNKQKGPWQYVHLESEMQCQVLLAKIRYERYIAEGDTSFLLLAEQHIQFALSLIRQMREGLPDEADKLHFGEYAGESFELAADIHFARYQLNPDVSNLHQVSELQKAQALLTSIKSQRVNRFRYVTEQITRTEAQLSEEERGLLHDISFQLSQGEEADADVLNEIDEDYRRLLQRKTLFLDSLAAHLPGYFDLKYSRSLVSVNELQRQLPANGILVEWIAGRNSWYAIGIASEQTWVWQVADKPQVTRQIAKFCNELRYKFSRDWVGSGEMLARKLWLPIDSTLRHHRKKVDEMIIVPEGPLTALPFEALVLPGRSGQFLAEKFVIRYNYSATLHWQKESDPAVRLDRGLIGVAPVFGAGAATEVSFREDAFEFSYLPGAKSEVEFISSSYQKKMAGNVYRFMDEFDEKTFKALPFRDVSVVHLATHGFADGSRPKSIGVALGNPSDQDEDNILYMEEVYQMNLPVELISISACETGVGKWQRGEGLLGLARAFFYAGARSVMVSMWKVEDESTAELMKTFYEMYFRSKADKATALAKAKRTMLKSSSYRHPYYWSSFLLFGGN